MPQCRPLARKPAGAVMPPGMERTSATMLRRRRAHACQRLGALEIENDRVLSAVAEQRTRVAVVRDLLRDPGMGNDREAESHEEPRIVRERGQLGKALTARAAAELVDHAQAKTGLASV